MCCESRAQLTLARPYFRWRAVFLLLVAHPLAWTTIPDYEEAWWCDAVTHASVPRGVVGAARGDSVGPRWSSCLIQAGLHNGQIVLGNNGDPDGKGGDNIATEPTSEQHGSPPKVGASGLDAPDAAQASPAATVLKEAHKFEPPARMGAETGAATVTSSPAPASESLHPLEFERIAKLFSSLVLRVLHRYLDLSRWPPLMQNTTGELKLLARHVNNHSKVELVWLLLPAVVLLALLIPFFVPCSMTQGASHSAPGSNATSLAIPQRSLTQAASISAAGPAHAPLLRELTPRLSTQTALAPCTNQAPSTSNAELPGSNAQFAEFTTASEPAEAILVSNLVVPNDCECSLFFPIRQLSSTHGPIFIRDINGGPIVRVVCEGWTPRYAHVGVDAPIFRGRSHSLQLLLQSPMGGNLAHCQTSSGEEFAFYHNDGRYFAMLSPSGSRGSDELYQLVMHDGTKLNFSGNVEEHKLNVTDKEGGLVAVTFQRDVEFQTEGDHYCARLAPGVDVGLLVCCFLIILARKG